MIQLGRTSLRGYLIPGALLLLAPWARAADYSVSPSGADGASGSASAPWLTLQHAADAIVAGDTVHVAPGSYAGFNVSHGGTSTARVTFVAQPGVVITTPATFSGSSSGSGILLVAQSYVTIDGFTIVPAASSAFWNAGVRVKGDAAPDATWWYGNIIRNCTCTMRWVNSSSDQQGRLGSDQCGILTSYQDGIQVIGNTLSGSWDTCIYIANSARNYVVSGNRCHDYGGMAVHNNGDASQGSNYPGINYRGTVAANICWNGTLSALGQTLSFDGVQDSVIVDNLLYAIHGKGISLFQVNSADGSRNNLVANNTVVITDTADGGAPLRISQTSTGNTIFNNVLYAANPAAASIDVDSSTLQGLSCDDNIVKDRFYSDGSKLSLGEWQGYGFDLHSHIATPDQLFVNAGAGDYHLSATSPALDAGIASLAGKAAPTSDLAGAARPQGAGFDIGAYEAGGGSGGNASPTVSLTSPAAGASFTAPATIVVSATAADSDGSVAKVDFYQGATLIGSVSSAPYSVTWSNVAAGSYSLTARATDNLGATTISASISVSVSSGGGGGGGGVSLWNATVTPAVPAANDSGAVEVGVKFRSDVAGTITGLSFFKGAGNTGTHVGHLWSRTGTKLASVTFANETTSGWQTATFSSPVTITANTTYVASYFAPVGHYAVTSGYFASVGFDAVPLHALKDGVDGGDGVYLYSSNGGFPTHSFQSSNYWVDVVFSAGPGVGLLGQYWTNQTGTFTGTPTLTRTDATVDIDWGTGSPDPSISSDHFSARWTGFIKPPSSGIWSFATLSDDGVRLWVNGQLLVDNWSDHAPTVNGGAITLTGGTLYPITLEYYEDVGGAAMHLLWSGPATPVSVGVAQAADAAAGGNGDGEPVPTEALYPAADPLGGSAAGQPIDGGSSHCGLGAGIALLAGLGLTLRRRGGRR